jgi:NAD(P)-dependent dehydrogenase (short-subunit alcohol dehydrogenase family)
MSSSLSILVTGASSGFGALTARLLARAGHQVYASMRSPSQEANKAIGSFAAENKCTLKPLILDVTKEDSCIEAINTIIKDSGHLDVIVHNAGMSHSCFCPSGVGNDILTLPTKGHMGYGPAEAFSPEQFLSYYDVNCVGPQRVNRAALPHMRARHSGLLVWVGSTSTRGGTPPFLAPYFAAKAGMDSLAVSYQAELSRFGIETSIIVPGAFTKGTNHFANAGQPSNKEVLEEYFGKDKPYAGMSEEILKALSSLEPPWADVEEVAREIVRVVGMQTGTRPFRTHIDPSDDGATIVNGVGDMARRHFYLRLGFQDLLQVSQKG